MENLNSVDFKNLKAPFEGDLFLVWKINEELRNEVIFATENEDFAKFFCSTCNRLWGSDLVFQYTIEKLIY